MKDSVELLKKYNAVLLCIRDNEISHFHLKSVKNFITYLNEINDITLKTKIATDLYSYLDLLETNSYSRDDSKVLFEQYIYPIGKIYERTLNFSIKIKLWIMLGWIIPVWLVSKFIFKSAYLGILFVLLILLIYHDSILKNMTSKVYGFNY